MMKIVCVRDANAVRPTVGDELRSQEFEVNTVHAVDYDRIVAAAESANLVLLDLDRHCSGGLDLLRVIRAHSAVPIVVATSCDDEVPIMELLNTGADDFVITPIAGEHLAAWLGELRRRYGSAPAKSRMVTLGDLKIDLMLRVAWLGMQRLKLSRREFDLLAYLAQYPGRVVSRQRLVENVWQRSEHEPGTNQTIDVHVSWLRRKLGETAAAPRYLYTVRGVGLKLCAPNAM